MLSPKFFQYLNRSDYEKKRDTQMNAAQKLLRGDNKNWKEITPLAIDPESQR